MDKKIVIPLIIIIVLLGLNFGMKGKNTSSEQTVSVKEVKQLKEDKKRLEAQILSLEEVLNTEKESPLEEEKTSSSDKKINLINQLLNAYYQKDKETVRSEQLSVVQKIVSEDVFSYLNNDKGETNFEADNLLVNLDKVDIYLNEINGFFVRYELTFNDGVVKPSSFILTAKGQIEDNRITSFEVVGNESI